MAKINHNNVFDTIDGVIENAKSAKSIHLYAADKSFKGDALTIDGKKIWHFANTAYLGLEQDVRLKQAAVQAIYNYGTQFPLSKTYVSHPLYALLEDRMQAIFGHPVIVAKNSTLAHIAAIPHLVGDNDAVILDHQVHWSVQNACQNLKSKGVPLLMIRHNNMEQLMYQLKKLGNKYRKIWYMADGVYSMYGDAAPVTELKALQSLFPKLHFYFDDVHGMSWVGKNGCGFITHYWGAIPKNMVLVSTLSKTFGASGAVIVCGDAEMHRSIKNFGGPLTFSAQLEPSSVAAATASAEIHLTEEIYELQQRLKRKVDLFASNLQYYGLPVVSDGKTPVFYIATAMPDTAYNMVRRLYHDGFFVNPGIFPAVPLKNAGLRITISNHNNERQIIDLAAALHHHLPLSLIETGNDIEKVYRAFGWSTTQNPAQKVQEEKPVIVNHSLTALSEKEWNESIGKQNALDYQGMLFLENYFGSLPHDNPNFMRFTYYRWYDENRRLLGVAHASFGLWKEDMLAPEVVSKKVEAVRKSDPLFLTGKALGTGSVFTEGTHFFVDGPENEKEKATACLIDALERMAEKEKADKLVLRDFEKGSHVGQNLINKGFVRVEMPDTAVFDDFDWEGVDGFMNRLGKRSKRHFKKDVLPYLNTFETSVKTKLNSNELDQVYALYGKVEANNWAINGFPYEKGLFEAMNNHPCWRFLLFEKRDEQGLVGVMFCYENKSANAFSPVLIGMEDLAAERLALYRHMLFKTIMYAKDNGFRTVYLGLSATFEKRKMGATIIPKEAYMQSADNYQSDLLQTFY